MPVDLWRCSAGLLPVLSLKLYVAHKLKTKEKHSPIKIKPYCFSACSLPVTVCELTNGSVQCCNTNLASIPQMAAGVEHPGLPVP